MLTLKEAAGIAQKYATDLFGPLTALRLEEVEASATEWKITLSFLSDQIDESAQSWGLPRTERIYKTFSVNKLSGDVTSMKIRNVQDA